MLEISVIRNGNVVYSKEFGNYIEKLKSKTPNESVMREMEGKFLSLVNRDKVVNSYYKIVAGVGITVLTNSLIAYANPLEQASDKVRKAFDPVIEMLAGLGFPITYMMLITGAIMVIMGKKSKGLEIIKWAVIGYLGLQFVPFFLKILEEIGKALRGSV